MCFGRRRRMMALAAKGVVRSVVVCLIAPWMFAARHRLGSYFLLVIASIALVVFLSIVHSQRVARELALEHRLVHMQEHLDFMKSLHLARQVDAHNLQKIINEGGGNRSGKIPESPHTLLPEVVALLKNLTGTMTASGIAGKDLELLHTPFVFQLLPHLLRDPHSLRPAYYMGGGRAFVDVVVGIPTIKRDKENYLHVTLKHLLDGMTAVDTNSTLIVVYIGETDLEYVVTAAKQIETLFPEAVKSGLIEVVSPSPTYYPDFDSIAPTLGDSVKRFKWRTKQNLDTIYLMAYGQTKGTYYLMLEDDVVAKSNYLQIIKEHTADITISNPHWFFIDYAHIGGIGKLFRSKDLLQMSVYLQIFHRNMPIDWLLESYLADRVCTIYKSSKECGKSKDQIRPRFPKSLFQHIGLYSSLKGKIQKIKNAKFGPVPTFYPHVNPPVEKIYTDIEEHSNHLLVKAYYGENFFWGIKPRKENVVEFWFQKAETIEWFTFRSGNVEHVSDRFYDTVVEALPVGGSNFTQVGVFDEFGLAEGRPPSELGRIIAIRLRVLRNSTYWAILSEVTMKIVKVKPH